MKLEQRVKRLEGTSSHEPDVLVIVRQIVAAENGQPAADQGELQALADRRAGKEWRRRRSETEAAFSARAVEEAKEEAKSRGSRAIALEEVRHYGGNNENGDRA